MKTPFLSRVASAPISWGICEVPGWGKMLSTQRVLSEMGQLGLVLISRWFIKPNFGIQGHFFRFRQFKHRKN